MLNIQGDLSVPAKYEDLIKYGKECFDNCICIYNNIREIKYLTIPILGTAIKDFSCSKDEYRKNILAMKLHHSTLTESTTTVFFSRLFGLSTDSEMRIAQARKNLDRLNILKNNLVTGYNNMVKLEKSGILEKAYDIFDVKYKKFIDEYKEFTNAPSTPGRISLLLRNLRTIKGDLKTIIDDIHDSDTDPSILIELIAARSSLCKIEEALDPIKNS